MSLVEVRVSKLRSPMTVVLFLIKDYFLRIHGFPYPEMFRDLINKLEGFHEDNAGSVYSMLSFLYLSMQKRILKTKDLILPVMLVVGDSSTGKSSLVKQMCSILPHIFDNGVYCRNYDNSATVSVIQERLSRQGVPIVMDPPPIPEQKDELNKTIDMVYEAKLKNTAHSKKTPVPLSSLIIVVQHDFQNLSLFNNTSISKSLLLFHERNNVEDGARTHEELIAKLLLIDGQIFDQSRAFSAIFRYLILPVNEVLLQASVSSLVRELTECLTKEHEKKSETMNHYSRTVKSAALVLSGFQCLLEKASFDQDEIRGKLNILKEFLIKKSILPTIAALDFGVKGRGRVENLLNDPNLTSKGRVSNLTKIHLRFVLLFNKVVGRMIIWNESGGLSLH